jgi:hypothetical protein
VARRRHTKSNVREQLKCTKPILEGQERLPGGNKSEKEVGNSQGKKWKKRKRVGQNNILCIHGSLPQHSSLNVEMLSKVHQYKSIG